MSEASAGERDQNHEGTPAVLSDIRGLKIDQNVPDEIFRVEVHRFIADHLPAGLSDLADWSPLLWGNSAVWPFREQMHDPRYLEWEAILLEERLVCASWPVAYGGRELSARQSAILDDEFLHANAPRVSREQAEGWLGPVVMSHGTDEQKLRFLPGIVLGLDHFAQGFSEPDHGSDLASVETVGEVIGDEIAVTGQKTWTTVALDADYFYVLCRTNRDVPKRKGLTFVVVPLRGNETRIDIRPIRQIAGKDEFCEVFFDHTMTPMQNVIGELGHGWQVAMTTLGVERAGRIAGKAAAFSKELEDLIELAKFAGDTLSPSMRQDVARIYTSAIVQQVWVQRSLDDQGSGSGIESSLEKLWTSESRRALGELAMMIRGPESLVRPDGEGYVVDLWQEMFLNMRGETIASGTSEIQRNILAERFLGLPREPRVE